jgi:acetylornithine deacetylase/succinyl-diaminopimelate desuccinylase-like protein
VRAQKSRVVQVLEDLIRIESVNVLLPGGQRGESEMARYVDRFCAGLGLEKVEAGGYPDRPNAVWRLRVPGATGSLLFEAHMDTVTLANMPDGTTPRIGDGRLYGRGASDTKGSLAGMLCAMEELARDRRGLSADILVGGIVEEEVGCTGAAMLVESGLRPDGIVVGEPTMLKPVIAHKGVTRFFIRTAGRSAHTSVPENGDNAIGQMVEVMRWLQEQESPLLQQLHHPLVGHPVQTVSLIRGGHQINFVPEECEIGIDRRTLPFEEPEAVLEGYRERLAAFCRSNPHVKAEIVRVHTLIGGMDTPPDSAVVRAALAAGGAVRGEAAVPSGVAYGTNGARYWGMARIPCVVLGPGDIAQAHTSDEWIAIDQLEASVPLYAELARHFRV